MKKTTALKVATKTVANLARGGERVPHLEHQKNTPKNPVTNLLD